MQFWLLVLACGSRPRVGGPDAFTEEDAVHGLSVDLALPTMFSSFCNFPKVRRSTESADYLLLLVRHFCGAALAATVLLLLEPLETAGIGAA